MDNNTMRQEGMDDEYSNIYDFPPVSEFGNFKDFEPLNLTPEERKTLLELHRLTQETGFEYGNTIVNGVAGEPFTSNLNDKVMLPSDRQNNSEPWQIFHSHTNGTPPSGADFYQLLRENVDKVGVVASNGDVYTVRIGNGEIPTINELDEFIETASIIAAETTRERRDFADWNESEKQYMRIKEQFFEIGRRYKWTMEGGNILE